MLGFYFIYVDMVEKIMIGCLFCGYYYYLLVCLVWFNKVWNGMKFVLLLFYGKKCNNNFMEKDV